MTMCTTKHFYKSSTKLEFHCSEFSKSVGIILNCYDDFLPLCVKLTSFAGKQTNLFNLKLYVKYVSVIIENILSFYALSWVKLILQSFDFSSAYIFEQFEWSILRSFVINSLKLCWKFYKTTMFIDISI